MPPKGLAAALSVIYLRELPEGCCPELRRERRTQVLARSCPKSTDSAPPKGQPDRGAFPPRRPPSTLRRARNHGRRALARGWVIGGISERTREAVTAAAEEAGVPVGAWVEQALREALEGGPGTAAPAGVELGELEAMVRRVVAEELGPVREALAHPAAAAPAVSAPGGGGSAVGFMRERRRQRRTR